MENQEIGKWMSRMNRRTFITNSAMGIGAMALTSLLGLPQAQASASNMLGGGILKKPHVTPRAKRVVFLFQSGGPSQFETFDYKPFLQKHHGEDLPDSVRKGQRLTGMSASQSQLPMVGTPYGFNQYGESGAWVSDLLPYTAEIADDLCIVKSLHTDQINHDPALTFFQTGHQLPGRPSIGSWLQYGLGSENDNLPAFIVLVSNNAPRDQPLYARLWGNGFLPSRHQGVQFRASADPVLYLNDPQGYHRSDREQMLHALKEVNLAQMEQVGDASIQDRIKQYEMAFRMQLSVPEVRDMSDEPDSIFEMYGEDSRQPGTYAANCLLARRLLEKDVRFVQLYHQGWDNHGNLPSSIERQCKDTDQASAALVKDLKQRGLLEDTLVIWGGEFGRTNYSQGKLTATNFGRDHHPRCFTMWMAGGGVKPGISYGTTDPFGYNIVENPVHVHDFQATLLHIMGIDHERLTYEYQGRRFRLTDVSGHVVNDILT